MTTRSEQITQAVHQSCITEIQAFKPGNVSIHSAGHGMQANDFIRSAELIGPVMGMPDLTVGERILKSVQLTMSQVGCNTNLGIILLCAPLAQAAFQCKETDSFRDVLEDILKSLTHEDAIMAFEAIALANPGGLGATKEHDVRDPASITLFEAMQVAADRDRIAWQYTNGFKDIFEIGLPRLQIQLLRWRNAPERLAWASVSCYLEFMVKYPDSHIIRKFDLSTAKLIQERTQPVESALKECDNPVVALDVLRRYDAQLKREGVNPGTSADMTVASMAALSMEALLS